ncbi:hypothetical protein OUZ56_010332 [Daphnia magna]|uniref:Uncharacterized protein n=1 Tax=Daphnia magna TaxID=35525 RepID=A0ABR0AIN8_9CRUS|nr:hypothetical protein OUZ56_010332 [Daphnia magna]
MQKKIETGRGVEDTVVADGIRNYKLMMYKLMVSQCIHIEYKIKNSWYQSAFTLNTKVETRGITVYSH